MAKPQFPDPVIYRRGDACIVAPCRAEALSYERCPGGLPEAPLIDWALTLIPEGSTFMDVGAHCGTWSTAFAAAEHPVIAFEPNMHLYACLTAGMALTAGNRYEVHPYAIGRTRGQATLTWPQERDWWGGGGSIVVEHDRELAGVQAVPVHALDDLDTGWEPALVKIDVEGSELDVLVGGRALFLRSRPKIIFECWTEERGQRREELFDFLDAELNYTVEPVSWHETFIAAPR